MRKLSELFGTPESGETECCISGPFENIVFKIGKDTGFRLEGQFNNRLCDSSGKVVAIVSGGVVRRFYTKGEETPYFLGGAFNKEDFYFV